MLKIGYLWIVVQIRFVIKALIKTNINISNELNFSDVYRSVNYIYWVTSKVNMNTFGVYLLCTRSSVVYASINEEPR